VKDATDAAGALAPDTEPGPSAIHHGTVLPANITSAEEYTRTGGAAAVEGSLADPYSNAAAPAKARPAVTIGAPAKNAVNEVEDVAERDVALRRAPWVLILGLSDISRVWV